VLESHWSEGLAREADVGPLHLDRHRLPTSLQGVATERNHDAHHDLLGCRPDPQPSTTTGRMPASPGGLSVSLRRAAAGAVEPARPARRERRPTGTAPPRG